MTKIVWDQVGDRIYQAGLDRGVLYKTDRSGVAWNGLRSVVEGVSGRSLTPVYHDGRKYGDSQVLGEFAGSIAALTYPDEFLEYEGITEAHEGLLFKNQALKRFHLSYRTLIGDGSNGLLAGYKIHILYNLLAIPRDMTSQTLTDRTNPLEFGWTISSVPEIVSGYSPVSHVVIDSRGLDPDLLEDLEIMLYGSEVAEPNLPTLFVLKSYIDSWVGVTIFDNGDGTWTALGSDQFIDMIDDTTFQISEANATYSDADTFQISTGTE